MFNLFSINICEKLYLKMFRNPYSCDFDRKTMSI